MRLTIAQRGYCSIKQTQRVLGERSGCFLSFFSYFSVVSLCLCRRTSKNHGYAKNYKNSSARKRARGETSVTENDQKLILTFLFFCNNSPGQVVFCWLRSSSSSCASPAARGRRRTSIFQCSGELQKILHFFSIRCLPPLLFFLLLTWLLVVRSSLVHSDQVLFVSLLVALCVLSHRSLARSAYRPIGDSARVVGG